MPPQAVYLEMPRNVLWAGRRRENWGMGRRALMIYYALLGRTDGQSSKPFKTLGITTSSYIGIIVLSF